MRRLKRAVELSALVTSKRGIVCCGSHLAPQGYWHSTRIIVRVELNNRAMNGSKSVAPRALTNSRFDTSRQERGAVSLDRRASAMSQVNISLKPACVMSEGNFLPTHQYGSKPRIYEDVESLGCEAVVGSMQHRADEPSRTKITRRHSEELMRYSQDF